MALDLGVDIVNDIQALRGPGALDAVSAHTSAGVCLMHMRGEPSTMAQHAQYDDVVAEVREFLAARSAQVQAAGVAADRIVLDPGIGFAKTACAQFRAARAPAGIAVARTSIAGRLVAQVHAGQAHWPRCRRSGRGQHRGGVGVRGAWGEDRSGARRRRHRGRSESLAHSFGSNRRLEQESLRHRWHSRHRRQRADHAGLHACARPCGGPRAEARYRTADRDRRQGHAHFRLHDRVGARGRIRLGRRRRPAVGAAAHAGCRVPDARTSARSGRGHQRIAQPVSPTTASSSFRRGARSCPILGSRPSRWRWPNRRNGSIRRGSARRSASTTRRGRYIEFCKSIFRHDLSLKGLKIVVDAAHGAAYHVAPDVLHELGAEVVSDRLQPGRLQHQRRRWRHRSRRAGRAR